jgi:hypothetical protein
MKMLGAHGTFQIEQKQTKKTIRAQQARPSMVALMGNVFKVK